MSDRLTDKLLKSWSEFPDDYDDKRRSVAIELLALREANRWIPGVPQNSAPVLVQVYCGDSDWQDVAWFNGITWFSQAGGMFHKGMNVAGWRALPAPPEKV